MLKKKQKLTKPILRQQLFQPQRWKASQYAFLKHITTWQKVRGGRGGEGGGGGAGRGGGEGEGEKEERIFLVFHYFLWVCTLKNCFRMESLRDLYLDFGCLDDSLEISATSSTAEWHG